MKRDGEKGFTLLELLLVLSVVSILTVMIIPIGKKWVQTTADEEAVQSLVSTIHSLQSYAIANEVWTRLHFGRSGSYTTYIASASGGVEFSRKLLPEGMRISNDSKIWEVYFNTNGNIRSPGTLTLLSKSGVIDIKLQFVRGRVIIGESKRLFLVGSDAYALGHSRRFWYASSAGNEVNFSAVQQEACIARC